MTLKLIKVLWHSAISQRNAVLTIWCLMKTPTNSYEALVLALELAVTAPTEAKSKDALSIAESISESMTEIEVMRAKKEVENNLKN